VLITNAKLLFYAASAVSPSSIGPNMSGRNVLRGMPVNRDTALARFTDTRPAKRQDLSAWRLIPNANAAVSYVPKRCLSVSSAISVAALI
jgi:hypothetical protein